MLFIVSLRLFAINVVMSTQNFKNLSRWYEEISSREAVIKGFDLLKRDEQIPKI